MNRRTLLKHLGLAPVALLASPRSRAEAIAAERAAHPFVVARVPQHMSPEERDEILRQIEAVSDAAVIVCDNTIEITGHDEAWPRYVGHERGTFDTHTCECVTRHLDARSAEEMKRLGREWLARLQAGERALQPGSR